LKKKQQNKKLSLDAGYNPHLRVAAASHRDGLQTCVVLAIFTPIIDPARQLNTLPGPVPGRHSAIPANFTVRAGPGDSIGYAA